MFLLNNLQFLAKHQNSSKYLGYLTKKCFKFFKSGRKFFVDRRQRRRSQRVRDLPAADGDDPLLLFSRIQLGRHPHPARRNIFALHQRTGHLNCNSHLVISFDPESFTFYTFNRRSDLLCKFILSINFLKKAAWNETDNCIYLESTTQQLKKQTIAF